MATLERNAAEQIAVNPDQTVRTINNAPLFNNDLELQNAVTNPNITNTKINNSLLDNKEFQTYLSDPKAVLDNQNRKFLSTHAMAEDPLWFSVANKHGDDLILRSEAIHGYYSKGATYFSRQADAWRVARKNQDVNSIRKDLSNARVAGDSERVAMLELEYAKSLRELEKSGYEFDSDFMSTITDVAASMRHNPEALAVGVAAGIGTALTGGALGLAIGAAGTLGSSASIFADTYTQEAGSTLRDIDEQFPDLSETRKHEIAKEVGIINGLIESVPNLLSFGVAGRAVSSLKKFAAKGVEKGLGRGTTAMVADAVVKSGVPAEIVATKTFGDVFKKSLVNGLKYAGEKAIDGSTEGLQEVIQNSVSEAAMATITDTNASILRMTAEEMEDFIAHPLAQRNAEKLNTFINVALSSAAFGVGMDVAARGTGKGLEYGAKTVGDVVYGKEQKYGSKTIGDMAYGASQNKNLAQKLFDARQNTELGKAAPEAIDKQNELEKRLSTDGNKLATFISKESIEELRTDPKVAKALQDMGVDQAIEDSADNGGNIELDFAKYDAIVNTDKELFQKFKDHVSFRPDTMSTVDFLRFVDNINDNTGRMLEEAKANQGSIYNYVKNKLATISKSEAELEFEAMTAQLKFYTMANMRKGVAGKAEDFLDKFAIEVAEDGNTSTAESDALHQFVGEKVQSEGLQKRFAEAKSMLDAGATEDEVFQKTRVKIAPDKKLRIQISDKDAVINEEGKQKLGWKEDKKKFTLRRTAKLSEILDHPTLYALYPELANIDVVVSTEGSFGKVLKIPYDEDISRLRQTLLHELQHAIQRMEGFARGGSQKEVYEVRLTTKQKDALNERKGILRKLANILRKKDVLTYWDASLGRNVPEYIPLENNEARALMHVLDAVAQEDAEVAKDVARLKEINGMLEKYDTEGKSGWYHNLWGEIEARLTEKLSYMSQEELDKIDPYHYLDAVQARVRYGIDTVGTVVSLPQNMQTFGEFNVLYDPESGEISKVKNAGSYFRNKETGQMVIKLAKDANATTFAHEICHMFVDNLTEAFNEGTLKSYWADKALTLYKEVGVDVSVPGVKVYLTEAQHEKISDLFTNYIKEGKTENKHLVGLFAHMAKAFRQLYRDLDMKEYVINDKIRGVFDSIMSTQEDIEMTQRVAGMLEVGKPEGVSDEMYMTYLEEMRNSQVKCAADVRKKLFAIETYKNSEEYRKAYDNAKLEALNELSSNVVYRVLSLAAANGNNPELVLLEAQKQGSGLEEVDLTVDDINTIIRDAIDGKIMDLDAATTQAAEEYMDAVIREKFNINKESMEERATRNMSKVRALVIESLMRSGKTLKDLDAAMDSINKSVDRLFAKESVKRLTNRDYWNRQEAKIVDYYYYYMNKKDDAGMAECRRNQAVVTLIKMRAGVLENKLKRDTAFIESIRGEQKKVKNEYYGVSTTEHRYSARAYDLLQSLAEAFGFDINYARRDFDKTVAEKLNDWVDVQTRNTFTDAGVFKNYIPFLTKPRSAKSLSGMTGVEAERFTLLFNSVKSIAGAEYQIELKNEKLHIKQFEAETRANFEKRGLKPFKDMGNGKKAFLKKCFGTLGIFTNPEPVLREVFGQDTMNRLILPFFDAAVKAERKGQELVDEFRKASRDVNLSYNEKTYATGDTLTYLQVADLLLAMGNEHAYENMLLKIFKSADEGTQARAERIVSEAINDNPHLVEFANTVWDLYKQSGDVLNKGYETRTNKLFVKKRYRAFSINGIKFEGGYVPERVELHEITDFDSANFNTGSIQERSSEKLQEADASGNIKSIVEITETELFQNCKQGLMGTAYNNVAKFVNYSSIEQIVGPQVISYIKDWMIRYREPKHSVNTLVGVLQGISTVSVLGLKATTAVLQLSGLTTSAVTIGSKYVARGIGQMFRNGEMKNPVAAARSKSDYMAARVGDPMSSKLGLSFHQRISWEALNTKLGRALGMTPRALSEVCMSLIKVFDAYVSVATWNGAYTRALEMGMSEQEAVLDADSAVRISQSDSMQISRSSAMENQLARVITQFSTWMIGMQSVVKAKWGTKCRKEAFIFFAGYAMVGTLFEAILRESMNQVYDDDDDKDFVEKVMNTWYNQFIETLGNTFVPEAGLGAYAGKTVASVADILATGETDIDMRVQSTSFAQTAAKIANAARYGAQGLKEDDEELMNKAVQNIIGAFWREGEKIYKKVMSE